MDIDDPTIPKASPRKVKFTPKVPPRRAPRRAEKKTEELIDVEAQRKIQELYRRAHERSRTYVTKDVKQETQVAFGEPSMSMRTFGQHASSNHVSSLQGSVFDIGNDNSSIASGLHYPALDSVPSDGLKSLVKKKKKEYVGPWDYSNSYYPITLPLRRPYAGNPELLDEEEFGEASADLDYNEGSTNSAVELGLMEECEDERLLFLQLPSSLPLIKRPASVKGKEVTANIHQSRSVEDPPKKGCSLEELPAGFMGKMLMYKSGAIKLKLGETVYDVSHGSDCVFAQEVAAINTKDKHYSVLGELDKRAIVTPDVDFLLQ